MAKDYKKIAADLTSSMERLQKGIPDTMKRFAAMGAAAKASGALDAKTKELIAIAIAVAVRCDGCIAAHTKAAEKYGVDREEILETLSMAVYTGVGPSVVYASQALDSFDEFSSYSK